MNGKKTKSKGREEKKMNGKKMKDEIEKNLVDKEGFSTLFFPSLSSIPLSLLCPLFFPSFCRFSSLPLLFPWEALALIPTTSSFPSIDS
jgi:hypothetical protein